MRRGAGALLLLAVACRPTVRAPNAAPAGPPTDAFAEMAEVYRLAARDLWPGYDPRAIPFAIYDGNRTLLFHHPAPPADFAAVPGRPGVWAVVGRHPSVTANSSAMLGGVSTATVLPASAGVPARSRAALLLHEGFHVHQQRHHPAWSANEVELFTYPVGDAEVLALARLEGQALRRALAGSTPAQRACWARAAIALRRLRFAALPAGAAQYERGTELGEGLARYVEWRATGDDRLAIPSVASDPEAVRLRAYGTGLALARLLDDAAPHWKAALAQRDSTSLDALLEEALARVPAPAAACTIPPAERDRVHRAAVADAAALRARRVERRRRFLEEPGWTLVITSPDLPLSPTGFDPLNVTVLDAREVLHGRFVSLRNTTGTVEVLGVPALTEAAGAHPLFDGVRTVTVTGLPTAPVVSDTNGGIAVTAPGATGRFRSATVQRAGRTVTIRVAASG